MKQKNYAIGETVFSQGDTGNCIYLIERGAVSLVRDYRTDRERELYRLHAGACFGMMSALERMPRFASAVVVTDAHLLCIPRDELESAVQQDPALITQILQSVCSRLRKITCDLLYACDLIDANAEHEKSAREKLADKIRHLSADYSRYLSNITHDARDGVMHNPLIEPHE